MQTVYILILLILGIGMSACQPKQLSAIEQQKFVCRTLIDGFLKTQSMNHYRLGQIEPIDSSSSNDLLYTYKAQQHGQLHIRPRQATLQFDCQKRSARTFQIKLHQSENSVNDSALLLRIELPEKQLTPLISYTQAVPKFALLK